ncbi:DUF305 domain-containing protein [Herbiconiux sp. KACC 21604]|uniref:DUF305 domain-containing protein n=1 Tax=unclassified Herbiconiux TaxID=2618217 RepID=UPI0014930D5A|nr:DUF305 domain-containing protein [Herbiconiux sp. SALV-R1]QJU52259.1 DUF305 domain-containing protein [Herbiconiux sp. SALV-R1]WPO87104.1 DUF305 domain-containing protein [Herbiconiux sp. KACC 21604]
MTSEEPRATEETRAAESTPARPVEPAAPGPSRGRLTLAAIVAAAVVALVAFSAGWLAAPRIQTPSDTSVEAGFARDMQEHHNQAVDMAMIVREQTDDPDVRQLAYDIATSQANQSGQMYAWLNLWGLPQAASQPSMTWMLQPVIDGSDGGHAHTSASGAGDMVPGEPMPGMATADDLERLSQLQGVEAEKLFLQLMIAHHQGGVEMAEAVEARSSNPLVLALAKSIVFAQSGEIDYMNELLAARQ